MFFYLFSKINVGISGGYNKYGMTYLNSKGTYSSLEPFQNSFYFKGHGQYRFNWINNLDVIMEPFLGIEAKNKRSKLDPGFFGGVLIGGSIDFEDRYQLYGKIGLNISYATFNNSDTIQFKDGSETIPLTSGCLVLGISTPINDNLSVFFEGSVNGLLKSHTLRVPSIKTETLHEAPLSINFENDSYRIGAGILFKLKDSE